MPPATKTTSFPSAASATGQFVPNGPRMPMASPFRLPIPFVTAPTARVVWTRLAGRAGRR